MPIKTCPKCLNEYRAERSTNIYCSVPCAREARAKKIVELSCNWCEKIFSSDARQKRKFCSQSCSASKANSISPKRTKVDLGDCVSCGKSLGRAQKKYCSVSCKDDQYIARWLRGEEDGSQPKTGAYSSRVRRFLLKEANFKCTKCNWCEVNPLLTSPILTIDHIDGNWKNNARENLVVICYNCHTLTPTFGALNVGNGAGARGTYNRMVP